MAGVNWDKMTMPQAGAMQVHNGKEERIERNHSNQDIDKSKSGQNFFVGCNDWSDAYAAMKSRVAEVDKQYPPHKKLDANKRIVCVSLVTYCPQAIYDNGQVKEFFEWVDKVQRQVLGTENVHGTSVHLDEMHNYIDTDGTERSSLAHGHSLVSAYAEWTDDKGKERKGINGKNFQTRPKMNELNKAIDEMCRREFGVPYMTGKGKGKGSGKTVEEVKAETQLRMAQKKNEDFVRSLEVDQTKTTKGFLGREKIVDKTPEEIQRDKEVKAAQAVLKDKDDVAKDKEDVAAEKELVKKEREELQAERQGMIDYLAEERAKMKTQVEQDVQSRLGKIEEERKQEHAEFEQKIAALQAEKEHAKSIANANAIKARTLHEKVMKSTGLKVPSSYTVDAQMRARAVQQQQQQRIEKGR